jgi:AcrR family transcriptional regulator
MPRPSARQRAGGAQRSRAPVGLDRDLVIDTALGLMDEHGVDGVSMRRLADALGVSATALYWHVGSKEGLWSAALERVMSRVVVSDEPDLAWPDRVRKFLFDVRRELLAHPSALDLSLRVGPPVWGGWRQLTCEAMVAAGFRGQDAVDYARIVTWQAIAYVRMERNAEQVAYVGKVVDAGTGKVIRHVPVEQASGGDGRSETSGYDPSLQYERMAEVFIAGLETVAASYQSGHSGDGRRR